MTIPYNIKYTSIDQSKSIDDHVGDLLDKLDDVLPRGDTSARAQIELEKIIPDQKNGYIYRAEINLHTAIGDFYIDETDFDILGSTIKMRDAIIRDVGKKIERLRDRAHDGARKIKEKIHGA